ncbi:MAG: bacteriohemerythrin [Treponema sp.]|jgi:hemerythrin|nr:bacteriohemerythrin [Treponema sp.]
MESNNTEQIMWSDSFLCGIKQIDDQHKRLVDLTNELFSHVSGSEEEEYVFFNKVIQELVKYIKAHFATEEKMMIDANFSGYAEHKGEHEKFMLTVVDNIKDYLGGQRLTHLSFSQFLKDWILTHIVVMDKQCFESFSKTAEYKRHTGSII